MSESILVGARPLSCVWGRLSPSEADGAPGGGSLVVFPEGVLGGSWPDGPPLPGRTHASTVFEHGLIEGACHHAVAGRLSSSEVSFNSVWDRPSLPRPNAFPARSRLPPCAPSAPSWPPAPCGPSRWVQGAALGVPAVSARPVRTGTRGPSWVRGSRCPPEAAAPLKLRKREAPAVRP